jgi:hypothetical protein
VNEATLYTFILAALNAGLVAMGITGVTVSQDFQPTIQGEPSGPTLHLHTVSIQRYGYLGREDVYANGENTHTETQVMIATLQINAKVNNDPTMPQYNPLALTAMDYVNAAASVLQNDFTRYTLKNNGIGVFRITEGRVNHFKDEKQRYEADPSYDCMFTYTSVITSVTPSTPTIIGTVDVILT